MVGVVTTMTSLPVFLCVGVVVGVVHHVYRITCLRLGELNLDLQVGNGPTSKNLFPATASTSTRCVRVCTQVFVSVCMHR